MDATFTNIEGYIECAAHGTAPKDTALRTRAPEDHAGTPPATVQAPVMRGDRWLPDPARRGPPNFITSGVSFAVPVLHWHPSRRVPGQGGTHDRRHDTQDHHRCGCRRSGDRHELRGAGADAAQGHRVSDLVEPGAIRGAVAGLLQQARPRGRADQHAEFRRAARGAGARAATRSRMAASTMRSRRSRPTRSICSSSWAATTASTVSSSSRRSSPMKTCAARPWRWTRRTRRLRC